MTSVKHKDRSTKKRPRCQRIPGKWVRGYCDSCYVILLRCGDLERLPKPELPTELTQHQKSVLTGHLLGDGHISRYGKSPRARLVIARKGEDVGYLAWTASVFSDFSAPRGVQVLAQTRQGKPYQLAEWGTRAASVFKTWHDLWYPKDRIKIVPKDLVLDAITVAVWFADDGWMGAAGHRSLPWRTKVQFSTQGFTYKEVLHLSDLLMERYKVEFKVYGAYAQRSGWGIYGNDKAARAMADDIDCIFPSGISRKAYWRRAESAPQPIVKRPRVPLQTLSVWASTHSAVGEHALKSSRTLRGVFEEAIQEHFPTQRAANEDCLTRKDYRSIPIGLHAYALLKERALKADISLMSAADSVVMQSLSRPKAHKRTGKNRRDARSLSPKAQEDLRRQALALVDAGHGNSAVASLLEVTPNSVRNWQRRRQISGDQGIVTKPCGRKARSK